MVAMTDTTTDTAVPAAYLTTIANYFSFLNETDEAARRD